jgi:hypothetical protein
LKGSLAIVASMWKKNAKILKGQGIFTKLRCLVSIWQFYEPEIWAQRPQYSGKLAVKDLKISTYTESGNKA